jgi:tetratricopeptide (TPR) repeat protein
LARLESQSPGELFDLLFSGPMCGVIPRPHKNVLLIDALDEATQSDGTNPLADLLDNHLRQLPEWVGAVVTSRPDPSTLDRLGRYAPVEIQAGDERNLGDLREFSERFLAECPTTRGLGAIERHALVETLVRKSEGMVLYLQRIAEAISQGTLNLANIDSIGSGISGLESQYLRDFQHRFAEGFEEKFQPLLRLLLGAQGDLPEDFCAAVLGDKESVRRTRIRLGSYISCDSGRLRLFHKTLADWLAGQRSSVFFTDPDKGRQRIAEFLWNCFVERDRDSEDKKTSLRWEEQVSAWLPDLLPLLPQWRKAPDLRLFGEFLNSRKHYKASVAISGRAYRIRKREKGPSHKYTLRAGGTYGIALRESGDLEKAEPLLREILRNRRDQGGEKDPMTIQAMENLAKLLYLKKSYTECLELRQRVCDLLAAISGEDSEKTQSATYRLGIAEETSGKKELALATFTRLLHIREEKIGFSDIRTLRVANRIAVIQRDSGDLESAQKMAQRLVNEMAVCFSPTDPYLLTNRSLLGNIEEKLGNHESAETQYRLALEGRLANDPNAPSTILSFKRLASLLLEKGEIQESAELLERAWNSRGGIQSFDDQPGQSLLETLALVWNETGRRKDALDLMRRNSQFFKTGDDTILYNLACYECLDGNLDEAKRLISEHLSHHPDKKQQALADSDLEAICDFIEKL